MSQNLVTYLGNPRPHEVETEAGKIKRVARTSDEPGVTEVHWQPEIADELVASADEIHTRLAEVGKVAILERLIADEDLLPYEVALKHVVTVARAHAAEGFSFVAAHDQGLGEVLALFLEAPLAPTGTAPAMELAKVEVGHWDDITAEIIGPTALITKAGKDFMHASCWATSGQPATANQIALSANNEAVADTSTSLTGEITTAEGGLLRKAATYAHTTGTTTATLSATFTMNSHDAAVTVNKFGVLNKAASGGTLVIETKITAAAFAVEGDNTILTETITIA